MVTYHYVKFYVSIIIHVEVININASKLIIIIILFSHGIVRHLSQSSNFMKLHMNVIHYV